MWVTYSALESLFVHLEEGLKAVRVRIESKSYLFPVTIFRRLEILELNSVMFDKDPNDLYGRFGDALEDHEEMCESRHLLKVLFVSGTLHRPDRVLVDLLALSSTLSNIESLTVGGVDVPNYIGKTGPAPERLSSAAQAQDAFKDCSSWGLLSRLVALDISLVDLVDERVHHAFRLSYNNLYGTAERHEVKYRSEV
ncbi:hypothetical protein BG015_012126 [Linnemannia schmuckeri]|uniref:Uncharacterized protein n=1 Tax=Linnemannia schmuckeri TaxID=64567 RepID=A0A9P5V7W0_9FUNG|nr:hypothetical protein BG015_012126 [Linnemannia schmuckeri]